MELELHSDLIYKNNLDTDKFARMLNDPSQCYKFYWLEAIVNLITITEEDLTFDQIINEMICVNTDELVHTARSSSACFPVFQCTLSAA